jgi:hypothetical protein
MLRKIVFMLLTLIGQGVLTFAQAPLEVKTSPETIGTIPGTFPQYSGGYHYYPNGRLYYIASKSYYNTLASIDEVRDSTGAVLATHGNGVFIQYSRDFKRVEGIGRIREGLKNGHWTGVLADSVVYTCIYDNGKLVSGISSDKSGKRYRFVNELEMTRYAGYRANLDGFLRRHIDFDALGLKKSGITAYGLLAFTVDKDGRLSGIKLQHSVDPRVDSALLKAMRLSSPWLPEYHFGVPVSVQYVMTVYVSPRQPNINPKKYQFWHGKLVEDCWAEQNTTNPDILYPSRYPYPISR